MVRFLQKIKTFYSVFYFSSLIKKSNYNLFNNFKTIYGDILFGWQMLNKRSEILKNMCFGKGSISGVEFAVECKHCGKLIKGPSCVSCKKSVMHCVLCRLPVRGAANVCLICGHGGHTKHLEQWFSVGNLSTFFGIYFYSFFCSL